MKYESYALHALCEENPPITGGFPHKDQQCGKH